MAVNLALPRLSHGNCGITDTVTANASTIPTDGTDWPTSPTYYPMLLELGGEVVRASGITGSPQSFTGVQRALNGVIKSHPSGTKIDVASPIRGSLGAQNAALGFVMPINPPVPPGEGTPAPTIPTFSSTPTVITTAQNAATVVAAAAEGTHFLMAAGTHTLTENVRLKTNQHIRLATGCIIEGTGKGYCFRPAATTTTGVAIGGDPGGARPIIRNFGNGTTHQHYGAIMGRNDDVLGGAWDYQQVENWFIYHLDFDRNSANGVVMGDYWTVYDCEFHGHKVCGLGGDRGVGGLIWGNLFYWNALDPATGNASNGAHVKLTFWNGSTGRTAITPVDRARSLVTLSHNRFETTDRGAGTGTTGIHVWFDLDCEWSLVEYSSFWGEDIANGAVFFEGSNNFSVEYNEIHDFVGYGPAYNDDFTLAALAAGESTNGRFYRNTLTGCNWTLLNRLSNRTYDWYRPTQSPDDFVNFAWAAGPRYWILATETIPGVDGQSNMWTGNITFEGNLLVDCLKVVINEGKDGSFSGSQGGGSSQIVHGKTPMATIVHAANNYNDSPSIEFYVLSNSPLTLAQWLATGRQ